MSGSPFENRLRKTAPHRRRWAARQKLTAYRLYDRDIPEYRYTVDFLAGRIHVVEYARNRPAHEREAQRAQVLSAIEEVLAVDPEKIFVKTKEPKPWGRAQYEKLGDDSERFFVEEGGLSFLVNAGDYVDTGLFLDHRKTRALVREEAKGKRFLNLFCYTGSFTVYAAAGGAIETTSVDLSNTYLEWAQENLERNGLAGPRHRFLRSDVTRWLAQHAQETFELIVLDPPSFSASKKMTATFDIQRDHPALLRDALTCLAPHGTLYFSTNFRGFVLDPDAFEGRPARELTPESIPEDIRDRQVHRCWRIEG